MKPIISEEDLLKLLPEGSGINCEWDITVHENGNLTAKNSFHDGDNGYKDFTVKLFRVKETRLKDLEGKMKGRIQIVDKKGDIEFTLTCVDNLLVEYLTDVISNSLESILTKREWRNSVISKINITDKEAEQLGNTLIKKLSLKVKENGRVDTIDGDKTPLGLGLTVIRYIEEGE